MAQHPPTYCLACGEIVDRDSPLCRVCGEDHSQEPDGALFQIPEGLKLDQLGEWSQIKHEIIEKYAYAYTTIVSKQKLIKKIGYIDAHSGVGVAETKDTGVLVAGSAARALEVTPPFDELHFIEEVEAKASVLRTATRTDPRVHVHTGDMSDILTNHVLPRCRYEDYVRALCLIDPYGLTVPWTVVQTIGQMRSIEIFYNFMIMGANRNVLWSNPERVPRERLHKLDLVWGDRSWNNVAYDERSDLFGPTKQKMPNEAIAQAFKKRLKDVAGFAYVPDPIPMKNTRGATVYYLYFASPNATANKIVTEIFNKYRH